MARGECGAVYRSTEGTVQGMNTERDGTRDGTDPGSRQALILGMVCQRITAPSHALVYIYRQDATSVDGWRENMMLRGMSASKRTQPGTHLRYYWFSERPAGVPVIQRMLICFAVLQTPQ